LGAWERLGEKGKVAPAKPLGRRMWGAAERRADTMLNVYHENNAAMLNRLMNQYEATNVYYQVFAGMGGYGASNIPSTSPLPSPTLTTSGACGCLIIVVQAQDGRGALGHYPGTDNVDHILDGLRQMVAQLRGATVDAIAFGAGIVGTGQHGSVLPWQSRVMSAARARYCGAQVLWPKPPAKGPEADYGSCLFFPKEFKALFFDEHKALGGTDNPRDGVTLHDFTYDGWRPVLKKANKVLVFEPFEPTNLDFDFGENT
jgi:hypothetical protein